VVCGVVDGVDSDGVDAQLLEIFNVTSAARRVGNGISNIGRTTRLIVDTTDIESIVSGEESC
jgi:hypothetical protein